MFISENPTFCSSADHGAGSGVDGEVTSATLLCLVVTERSSSAISLSTSSLAGSGPVSHYYAVTMLSGLVFTHPIFVVSSPWQLPLFQSSDHCGCVC